MNIAITLWSITCIGLFVGCSSPPEPRPAAQTPTPYMPVESAQPAYLSERVGVPPTGLTDINELARFLAGMPGQRESHFDHLRTTYAWNAHWTTMDKLWSTYEHRRLNHVRKWQQQEMRDLLGPPVIFYPFSGPDFLHADLFFPEARNYVLCALEPAVTTIPLSSMSIDEIHFGIKGLETSLSTALNYSYFITKDMRVDLQRTRLKGVLPLMLVFLARTEHFVQEVQPVALTNAGTVVMANASLGKGFRIRTIDKNGRGKTIFYFREDLSNSTAQRNPRMITFARSFGAPVTYVKSASYLMHQPGFTAIRDQILGSSRAIFQDASGIPLRMFDQNSWDLNFYGNYTGPIDLFSEYYQPDLAQIFATGGPQVKSVDFGMGYNFNYNKTGIILARRRTASQRAIPVDPPSRPANGYYYQR